MYNLNSRECKICMDTAVCLDFYKYLGRLYLVNILNFN